MTNMTKTTKTIDCRDFRETPVEHQCVDGACYYGDTEETRKFGNCCLRCPKVKTCPAKCGQADWEHP